MDQEEIKLKIIKALGKHRTRNFIITDLCETAGMDWGDIDALVFKVLSG